MYILRIETENSEVVNLLNAINFDRKENNTFDLQFLNEESAETFKKHYDKMLNDFDDTDIYIFWEEENDDIDNYIGNIYTENGVNEKDFY